MTRQEFRQRRIALGLTQGFMAKFLGIKNKQRVDEFEKGLKNWPARKIRQAELILKPDVDTKEIYKTAVFILLNAYKRCYQATRKTIFAREMRNRRTIGIEGFLDIFIDMMFQGFIAERLDAKNIKRIFLSEETLNLLKQAKESKYMLAVKRKKRRYKKRPWRKQLPPYLSKQARIMKQVYEKRMAAMKKDPPAQTDQPQV